MTRTHKSLEGKRIKYIYESGLTITGIITGCNKDIGITIQDVYDKDHYLLCINGPSSPKWTDKASSKEKYFEIFKVVVDNLFKGFYKVGTINMVLGKKTILGIPSIDTCPFSQ